MMKLQINQINSKSDNVNKYINGFNNKRTTVKTEESYSSGSENNDNKRINIDDIIEEENDENLCDFEKYVSYKKN